MELQTDVLINGAGPTGLMMACQLRRFGINCLVIDKKAGPTVESRALAVQARTLEIYEQMSIADKALELGQRLDKMFLVVKGKLKTQIEIGKVGEGMSRFKYLFVLEQNKNEVLLYDHLKNNGGEVKWNTELKTFDQQKDHTIVHCSSGNEEVIIKAKYLIAADGASSIIRHLLQMQFDGGTYENMFYVADTATEWPWGHHGLTLCLSKRSFMGLFAMKGDKRFRVIGVLPHAENITPKSFDEIRNKITELANIPVEFSDTKWFSTYRVHHRCVKYFRVENIFFTGDAAHVHSPAGGQGMNTGLQDAYNLAWKLAFVINGKANERILDSYHDERKPVATRLLKTTDRAFTFVTSPKWWPRLIRLRIAPLFLGTLLKFRWFQKFMFGTLSQTRINYQESSLSITKGKILKAGTRVPFVNVDGESLYNKLVSAGFTLLLFDVDDNVAIRDLNIVRIKRNKENDEAFNKFIVKQKGVFLIRPDNYIGYSSEEYDINDLKVYLGERLGFVSNI